MSEQYYMNLRTGEIDTLDNWHSNGRRLGLVKVKKVFNESGQYWWEKVDN